MATGSRRPLSPPGPKAQLLKRTFGLTLADLTTEETAAIVADAIAISVACIADLPDPIQAKAIAILLRDTASVVLKSTQRDMVIIAAAHAIERGK